MAIEPLDFPTESLAAATAGVMAVSLVLVMLGPQARATRETQRAWNDGKAAAVDGLRKFEKLAESMKRAKDATAALSADPNSVVPSIRRAKAAFGDFVDDLDFAILAFETMQERVSALKKHAPIFRRVRPDFDVTITNFEALAPEFDATFRTAVEKLHDQHLSEQFDEMLAFVTEATTQHVLVQSSLLAVGREPPSVEQALASLKKIHAYLPDHGKKRTG